MTPHIVEIRKKILEAIENEQEEMKVTGNKSSEKQSQKTGNNLAKGVNL